MGEKQQKTGSHASSGEVLGDPEKGAVDQRKAQDEVMIGQAAGRNPLPQKVCAEKLCESKAYHEGKQKEHYHLQNPNQIQESAAID